VNAVKPDYSGLAVGFDSSGAEEIARRPPGGRVVAVIPPFAGALASGSLAYECELTSSVFICGEGVPGPSPGVAFAQPGRF
jgi:hypothetical protein